MFFFLQPLMINFILQNCKKKSFNWCKPTLNTPSDKCPYNHGIEDTNRSVFSSPFSPLKETLPRSVIQILQKYNTDHLGNQTRLYLNGHQTINFTNNTEIFLSTIKYTTETRRFST